MYAYIKSKGEEKLFLVFSHLLFTLAFAEQGLVIGLLAFTAPQNHLQNLKKKKKKTNHIPVLEARPTRLGSLGLETKQANFKKAPQVIQLQN